MRQSLRFTYKFTSHPERNMPEKKPVTGDRGELVWSQAWAFMGSWSLGESPNANAQAWPGLLNLWDESRGVDVQVASRSRLFLVSDHHKAEVSGRLWYLC